MSQEKVVRRYGHFEIFFTDLWDWGAPVDSLQVLYEHWREDPIMQKEAANVFQDPAVEAKIPQTSSTVSSVIWWGMSIFESGWCFHT